MTLEKKSTATQELGALSDVIISAADPHRRSRAKVLDRKFLSTTQKIEDLIDVCS